MNLNLKEIKINPYFHLFLICLAQAGIQFGYSLYFTLSGPLFSSKLKFSPSLVQIIFAVVGPSVGFTVQPIIGAWSDNINTRFGKRKPFMFVGIIINAIGMSLIASSTYIGNVCGDDPNGESVNEHIFGTIFAVTGFLFMCTGLNTSHACSRALVTDLTPTDKIQLANLILVALSGFSSVIANVLGGLLASSNDFYVYIFIIAIFVNIICVGTSILFATNDTYDEKFIKTERHPIINVTVRIFKATFNMPKNMVLVLLLYFGGWAAFSPFNFNLTNFFAVDLYHGEDDVKNYNEGLSMGLYCMAIFSFIQMVSAIIFPFINKYINDVIIFIITHVLATAGYALFYFVYWENLYDDKPSNLTLTLTYTISGIVAIAFTQVNSLPFSLMEKVITPDQYGVYTGVMNSVCVLAQIIMSFISMGLLSIDFGSYWLVEGMGCIAAILTAIVALSTFNIKQISIKSEKRDIFSNYHSTSSDSSSLLKSGSENESSESDYDEKDYHIVQINI